MPSTVVAARIRSAARCKAKYSGYKKDPLKRQQRAQQTVQAEQARKQRTKK